MGEAKRKAKRQEPEQTRSWAKGSIKVIANGVNCFTWSGTRNDAIDHEDRFQATMTANGLDPESYAKRAAGGMMVWGLPAEGDLDHRPSNLGKIWTRDEIAVQEMAIVHLVLSQRLPGRGQTVLDAFVGQRLVAFFTGDRAGILADTARELRGKPFSGDEFQLMVGVDGEHRLDPRDAIEIPTGELFEIAGERLAPDDPLLAKPTYVPRRPRDADEARAMLEMTTVVADATAPGIEPRTFSGFTMDELRGGKPAVIVR